MLAFQETETDSEHFFVVILVVNKLSKGWIMFAIYNQPIHFAKKHQKIQNQTKPVIHKYKFDFVQIQKYKSKLRELQAKGDELFTIKEKNSKKCCFLNLVS